MKHETRQKIANSIIWCWKAVGVLIALAFLMLLLVGTVNGNVVAWFFDAAIVVFGNLFALMWALVEKNII